MLKNWLDSVLTFREMRALERLSESLGQLPKNLFNPKKFIALLVFICEVAAMFAFDIPQNPCGQTIDLTDGWELVWSDEFDGDSIDKTKWNIHWGGATSVRRGGFWDGEQILVSDGTLKIRTEYRDGKLGEGWYSGEIESKDLFEKKYGYFECRCICPGGMGLWAAFWTLGDGMFETPSGSAANGCEIDMFESGNFGDKNKLKWDGVNQATGYDGYGEDSSGVILGRYKGKDIYTQYNTYGLEWNENEIIFYINGVETDRLSGEWVPQVEQYLLLSVEVAGTEGETGIGCDGVPLIDENDNIENNDMSIFPLDYVVDYVRVYDKVL